MIKTSSPLLLNPTSLICVRSKNMYPIMPIVIFLKHPFLLIKYVQDVYCAKKKGRYRKATTLNFKF